ncbi:hypothetical protein CWD94_26770 [Lysinibacillus xylanilyticus]|uniref:Uncharacterized protein n=1 Tax=Lysinibacillus xylanilyticus TaxID=582475 RepID=A0A2M9PY01_9BACI|nr:hypothetical protein CWD94_26770 [Lysinibacillus xylanilyticus]
MKNKMVKEIVVNDVMHYMRVISIGRPQKLCSVRKRSDSKCFICAKAKRQQQQQQSAQTERKSTPHFAKDNTLFNDTLITLTQIFQLQGSQHMKLVLFKLHMY